jgi:hypothetical protein
MADTRALRSMATCQGRPLLASCLALLTDVLRLAVSSPGFLAPPLQGLWAEINGVYAWDRGVKGGATPGEVRLLPSVRRPAPPDPLTSVSACCAHLSPVPSVPLPPLCMRRYVLSTLRRPVPFSPTTPTSPGWCLPASLPACLPVFLSACLPCASGHLPRRVFEGTRFNQLKAHDSTDD